jgi:hypothetical protein
MATTRNFTDGSLPGHKKQHATTPRGFSLFTLRNIVDTTQSTCDFDAAADIAQALLIPAGTTVLAVSVNVLTVDANGAVLSCGVTGVDATKWGSAIPVTPVGEKEVTGGPVFNPLYFAAADTIDLLSDGGGVISDGVFEVKAICVKSSDTIDAGA